MGNPTTYKGLTCAWEKGRQLASIADGTNKIEYEYDVFGLRKAKKIYEPATAQSPTETTSYIYENGKLLRQVTGGEVMDFYYGSEGVIGFKLSGSSISSENGNYLYRKNLFRDITGIINESGALVYDYTYSAFGKSDRDEETGIGAKNPFRYRGYYYDDETGLYYLKSRYYDPETGRFITIDDISYLDPETKNGLNLYAYCGNNPVMRIDENGNAWEWLGWLLTGIVLVGLAVATVLTFGAAAPITGLAATMVTGAMIGATVGFGASILTQAAVNGWDNINPWHVLTDTLVGGIGGALSGLAGTTTSVTLRLSTKIARIALGAVGTVANGIIEGNSFSEIMKSVGFSIILGVGLQGGLTFFDYKTGKLMTSVLEIMKLDGSLSFGFNQISLLVSSTFAKILWKYLQMPIKDYASRIIFG